MKHPLLLAALCATGAVAVLSGVAIAAFAAPVESQTATVRGIAPLTVPIGHHPSGLAAAPTTGASIDGKLVIVRVAGALTLGGSPAARNSAADSPVANPGTANPGTANPGAAGSPAAGASATVPPMSAPVIPAKAPPVAPVPSTSGAAADPEKPEKPAKPEKPSKPDKPTAVEDVTGIVGTVLDDTGLGGHGKSDDKSGKNDK